MAAGLSGGGADISSIPMDAIERIDVVTDSASAIYGSDAVAGVVNFVLKRNFEGLRVSGQYGISSRNDRGSGYVSVVAGKNFFDGRASGFARTLKPSARGELEILDLIACYQALGELGVQMLGRGFAWLDTGTHDALIQAGEFVRAIEERQGLRLGCVEEIAFQNGWIDRAALLALAKASGPYGAYLAAIAESGA